VYVLVSELNDECIGLELGFSLNVGKKSSIFNFVGGFYRKLDLVYTLEVQKKVTIKLEKIK